MALQYLVKKNFVMIRSSIVLIKCLFDQMPFWSSVISIKCCFDQMLFQAIVIRTSVGRSNVGSQQKLI